MSNSKSEMNLHTEMLMTFINFLSQQTKSTFIILSLTSQEKAALINAVIENVFDINFNQFMTENVFTQYL